MEFTLFFICVFVCAEWCFRPDYIINELNINSVITTPAQGDILLINSLTVQTPYTIRGYAYSGKLELQ